MFSTDVSGPPTSPAGPARFVVRSTVDLLAAVPYLLGFHPADSVVVVALRGGRVAFVARDDLPAAGASGAVVAADRLAGVVLRQGVHAAVIIGYGPPARVSPAVVAVRAALAGGDVAVVDVIRVTAGRYRSYLCADPACCPPAGTAFDPTTTVVAAEAVLAGQPALPDRAALVRQLAPVAGPAREALRRAGARAAGRLAALVSTTPAGRAPDRIRQAGRVAVRAALARQPAGPLSDDEVAWLTLLLRHLPVRDFAWRHATGRAGHLALWTDVLRRAEPRLVPAPASLLAGTAWRRGQGPLASVAVDRALAADPEYTLAVALDGALRSGTAPPPPDDWPRGGPHLAPRVRRPVSPGPAGWPGRG